MLKSFRRLSIAFTLCAAALATVACGRISPNPGPPPPAAAPMRAGMPANLPGAVALARTAVTSPDPQLIYVAAYGVTPMGRLADSVSSGWVVGFIEQTAQGTRAALVEIDCWGQTRLIPARPPAIPAARLKPEGLPPMRTALDWARAAGLPRAMSYQMAWVATTEGITLAVGERTPLGSDPLAVQKEDELKLVLLDAASGKPLAPPRQEETAKPDAAPDSAEDAVQVATAALGFRRRP